MVWLRGGLVPPPVIVAGNLIIPLNENSPKEDEALGGMALEAGYLVQAYLLAVCPGTSHLSCRIAITILTSCGGGAGAFYRHIDAKLPSQRLVHDKHPVSGNCCCHYRQPFLI